MIIEVALGILLAVFLLVTIQIWLPLLVVLAGLIVGSVILVTAALILSG